MQGGASGSRSIHDGAGREVEEERVDVDQLPGALNGAQVVLTRDSPSSSSSARAWTSSSPVERCVGHDSKRRLKILREGVHAAADEEEEEAPGAYAAEEGYDFQNPTGNELPEMEEGGPASSLGADSPSRAGSIPERRKSQNSMSSAMEKFSASARKSIVSNLTRKKKYGDDLIEWSLNIFHLQGNFRQRCLYTVETPIFDKVILTLILLNSAAMAAYRHREVHNKPMSHKKCVADPTTYGCGRDEDALNKMIDIADPIFLVIFILECSLKIVAYGLFQGKKTYLRDSWNWLDFIVVLTGIITFCLENLGGSDEGESNAGSTIKMLRVFRVMRPLRSLTTLPELKVLVNTVLQSIPRLGSVLSMALFLLVIFGILGLNLWMGVFERRCRTLGEVRWITTPTAACPFADSNEPGRWSWPLALDDGAPIGRPCGGRYMCEDTIHHYYFGDKTCGSSSVFDLEEDFQPKYPSSVVTQQNQVKTFADKYEAAKFGNWCDDSVVESSSYSKKNDGNFNFGITNFNNFLNSVIVIFQCITLEGWTDVMYMGQDAHSNDFAFIYFCFLVVVGSFFLLNVALAVVWDAFQELSGEAGMDELDEEMEAAFEAEEAGEVEMQNFGSSGKEKDDELGGAGGGPLGVGAGGAPAGAKTAQVAPEEGVDVGEGDGAANGGSTDKPKPKRRVKSSALLIYEDEKQYEWFFNFASTPLFQNFVMACIILNIIIMMMDSYPPIKPPLNQYLDMADTVFSIIFGIEMMIVLLAIGPWNYLKERWHLLDGVIVVVSLIELAEKLSSTSAQGGGALKSLRLLRIIKLAKKWTSFRLLLQAVIHTVMSMGNFTILLVLMMFVFALMGSLIFANKLKFNPDTDEPVPEDEACPGGKGDTDFTCVRRAHFDYFLWSIVTVFQCLTGENWNAVMYDGMRGAGFGYFLFFFAMVVLGMCIIFNLFLAILMANFQDASEAIREAEDARREREMLGDVYMEDEEEGIEGGGENGEEAGPAAVRILQPGQDDEEEQMDPTKQKATGFVGAYIERGEARKVSKVSQAKSPDGSEKARDIQPPDGGEAQPDGLSPFSGVTSFDSQGKPRPKRRRRAVDKGKGVYKDITPEMGSFTKNIILICQHTWFENFILVMIIVSSLGMAFDDPLLYPQHPLLQTLTYLNVGFTVIFTAEMLMKHVAMGVRNYWSNGWNILDGAVVLVSDIDLVFWIIAETGGSDSGNDISFLKTLRILRALRPLRVIARNPNLKLVVNTIFASLPQLRTLMVLMILFFLIVGLVALNYLKGAFSMCSDGHLVLDTRKALESQGRPPTLDMCEYDCSADECSQAVKLVKNPVQDGTTSCPTTAPYNGNGYKRSLADVPICIAKCPLTETGDGVCGEYPALEKPTRKTAAGTVSDLPNKCTIPEPGSASTAESPIVKPEFSAAEPMKKTWRSAMEYNLMQCTKCKDRYCPGDAITQQCKDFCEDIKLLGTCASSCTSPYSENSAECQHCRTECAAACSCETNCEAMHEDAALCIEEGATPAAQLYKWVPGIQQTFDNIGFAMITLLEISTTEGWVDVMYAAVDARGIHFQPERDSTEIWSLFFVFFMLVGCFLILNLCVGVIVDNFAEMKKAQVNPGSSLLVTPAQQKWINSQKNLATRRMFLSLKNLEYYDKQRRNMFFFVNDDRFEGMIMVCIVLNAVVMAMKIFPEVPSGGDFDWIGYEIGLSVINYFFATVFLVEAGLKIFAYRLWYFYDGWNLFDFVCVTATLVGILLEFVFEIKVGALMSSIRLFRIARLLRLLRFAKGLNKIFNAFLLSIPKLFNVACILFLLMFLYAVMGVQMFGKVQFGEWHDARGNFRTFYRAFMTLVRAMTGEGWNALMHDLARNADEFGRYDGMPCVLDFDIPTKAAFDVLDDKCLIDNPIQCGARAMSYIYWVSYTMFITFVVFNLVVAVILEGFEDSTQKNEDEVVNLAIDNWKRYDPEYKLKLDREKAQEFIDELQLEMMDGEEKERCRNVELTDAEKEFLELKCNPDGTLSFVGVVQGALRQIMLFVVETREERAKLMDEIKTVEMSIQDPADPRAQLSSNILGALGYVADGDGGDQSPGAAGEQSPAAVSS